MAFTVTLNSLSKSKLPHIAAKHSFISVKCSFDKFCVSWILFFIVVRKCFAFYHRKHFYSWDMKIRGCFTTFVKMRSIFVLMLGLNLGRNIQFVFESILKNWLNCSFSFLFLLIHKISPPILKVESLMPPYHFFN